MGRCLGRRGPGIAQILTSIGRGISPMFFLFGFRNKVKLLAQYRFSSSADRRVQWDYEDGMRYLVRARIKSGRETELLKAIENRTLGQGSIAGDEYFHNMQAARLCADGTARWVEVCYCPTPLQEERPYWEEYFELTRVQDAHDRRKCRDQNGSEPWACGDCDCTERLEKKLASIGKPFLGTLRSQTRQ